MKKIYLFVKGAKRWNSLLNKFSKLHKRLQLLLNSDNETQYNKLVKKLQSIYSKLEKMQYQTGIKVATTSLAIILSAFTVNAQFAAGELLQAGGTMIYSGNHSAPTFADIDGDSDLDLYVGNNQGIIKVFTNNNGVYTAAAANLQAGGTDINVGYNSVPTFADIDGDGDLDLYVGEYYGKINVFTNTNGVFTAATDLQAGGTDIDLSYYAAPTFADIDGDGDLDLYVGDSYGKINVFTNNLGVFTATADLQAGGTDIDLNYKSAPTFADIDGDGDLDLYAGANDGTINVFTNTVGVFTAAADLQADGTNIIVDDYSIPSFADIDGDGDLDLYVGNDNRTIKVFTNDGAGVFSAQGDLESAFSFTDIDVDTYATPTFEDLDGDGDLDLYVGEHGGSIKVFTNTGGIFTAAADLQANGADINVGSRIAPEFADIDGDNDLDLYVGQSNGSIDVFSNTNGVFTFTGELQAGGIDIDVSGSSSPSFADIDGDGDLDLYAGANDATINVFTNSGGVFTAAADLQADGTDINVGSFASRPSFADINGDGDLDLYVGEWYGKIKVFTNSGGVFTAAADLQAGGATVDVGSATKPSFADIDGDGDLDLYVGNGAGNITFYENTTLSPILVNSITIQGVGSANTITTQGGTLQMSATVLPANASNSNYTWSVVNGTGSATIDANGLLTATGDGTVTVTVTANDASGETATFVVTISNQTPVQVILVSAITIEGAGNASTISTNSGTLQMSAAVLPANPDDGSYTWSIVNGTGSATISVSGLLTASADGTVEVTATANDASGTVGTKTVTISNQSVGINDFAFENISVYPNPTNGMVNLNISETLSSIRIMDLTGKTIQVFNTQQRQLDISNFTAGIYFLEIANAERKSVVKIVKK